ncbi:MAG: efflux RND transporter periplasmic adaptor subunit [Erythrobacter sp.]|jgi:cobalt-zinc-cadmium efflux system membrane fusion protein|uniref:Metal transporter n=1 Tax=Sphingopyxis macrogoltabida TaxID=33050 RepID=A0A0N9UC52_SPHMC|nr:MULTISPECIES: efflux RND transporter periplasmic adaptor subunit [Sphingomonadales]KEO86832.1 metal transporter [Erythrobacter sp. JL475]ALH81221.1 metal transporter [Sphingopyxis macrogoltabida]MBO6769059.1 efflux RND transporter periplasmic adaptor subunit [Erythrobacter sp.]MBX7541849.1 efflux RND transporter periplasmic adaptor subunit [Qipengyuania sphaerica]MCK0099565.1 efflux RND transporter periplasmic adaptor subunit [Qipengyuania sp. S6317L1]|tara:strand:- start:4977 stop:6122 length:1146 start_codon:yes stop_codon:yes gene_type:complete
MKRNILIAVAVVLLATAAIWAFWPNDSEDHSEDEHSEVADAPEGIVPISDQQIEASSIDIETVEAGSATELVFPATVAAAPNASARIDARASGVVRSVNKTLGDYVRKGETIASIESADAAALASQVAAARARVGELSALYDRERRLFEANVTARQDLEAAQANLQVARAELSRAQAAAAAAGVGGNGRSLAVTSPISGQVTSAQIVLGAYVSAGDELFQVVNASGLQVQVALPANDAARISPGDEATLELGQGREIGGRVRSVTPALDPESRSATAIIALRGGVPELRPGAFLQARIRPSDEADVAAISVPEEAVQMVEGRQVVFVRMASGFQAMPVTTGARSAGRIQIRSGLREGQRIATRNAFLLKAELGKEEAEHGH